MKAHLTFKEFNGKEKAFFIGLIVWLLLQISRFVAIPLINDISAGDESPAWLYPAYLDIVAAVFAVPLIIALFRRRGLMLWLSLQLYLVVSIVDHGANFVTTAEVGPPSIVGEGMDPVLAPAIQTGFDLLFVILLMMPNYRKLFFELASPTNK